MDESDAGGFGARMYCIRHGAWSDSMPRCYPIRAAHVKSPPIARSSHNPNHKERIERKGGMFNHGPAATGASTAGAGRPSDDANSANFHEEGSKQAKPAPNAKHAKARI
jgi:hypothetical protein